MDTHFPGAQLAVQRRADSRNAADAIWNIDPQVAIPTLKSMDDQVSDSVATERFQAIVLTSFGASALFLALLGRLRRTGLFGLAASAGVRHPHRAGLGQSALDATGAARAARPVLLGAGAGLALAIIALRLGAQSAVPDARDGSVGDRRQRAAACLSQRRLAAIIPGPPRGLGRSDAGAAEPNRWLFDAWHTRWMSILFHRCSVCSAAPSTWPVLRSTRKTTRRTGPAVSFFCVKARRRV